MALDLDDLDGTNGFLVEGADAYSYSGYSVAVAGDVNGDGFDDLIVGAPVAPVDGYYSGASYIVFGAAAGFGPSLELGSLDGDNGFRLDGIAGFDASGASVAGAGDVNGDGFADIIVGAPGATVDGETAAGESYVVFGAGSDFAPSLDLALLDGGNGFRLEGIDAYDGSGSAVAGAGDVNGDGFDDLIVGAPGGGANGQNRSGETYVVFGAAEGFAPSLDLALLDGSNGFRLDGIAAYDQSGFSVAGAGDVNGDGIDDLILGAPGATANGGAFAGASYVLFGSTAAFEASIDLLDPDRSNGFRLDGAEPGDSSGFSIEGAGDVNGDGIGDLIVGAYAADPGGKSYAGTCYVVFGAAGGFASELDLAALDGTNGFRLTGIEAYDQSGVSVAGAGDFNGDGFDDLIVGASGADPGNVSSAGECYVVFGSSEGFEASIDLATIEDTSGLRLDGIDEYDQSGLAAAGGGDVNGDGFDDVIVGAFPADPDGRETAGESYVIFGFATDNHGVTLTGTRRADLLEGTAKDDRIFGLGGPDTLVGRAGDDLLNGGAGRDVMNGGAGADRLAGGADRDVMNGGAGADRLAGGADRDVMNGGAGADRLAGGAGERRCRRGPARRPGRLRHPCFEPRFGADRIFDFDANPRGGQDRLDVRALGITAGSFDDDVTITDLGSDTRVMLADFGTILLDDVTGAGANAIGASDFLLA